MIFECQNRVAHKKDCNSYVFYAPINTLETLDPTNLTFWPHKIDQRTGISAAEICKESRVVPEKHDVGGSANRNPPWST